MATQKQLKEHFLNLKDAIYVWGANGQTITKALMDKLYNSFGSKTYDKEYYANKLNEGEGKIGADCSGAIAKISGYDTTAQGYYNKCTKKGKIDSIPTDKVCLVFKRKSSGKITHVGCYTGDGYVSEMAGSKKNYQRKPLEGNGWDDWGFADFVTDYDKEEVKYKMQKLKRGSKGIDVAIFQSIMKKLGYYKGEIDESFGKLSEEACNAFQADYPECGTNGKPDDSWGPKCWRKMFALVGA